MLDEKGVESRYRDYREDPLSEGEIREVLGQLGVGPRDVLRRQDKASRDLRLSGDETDAVLIALMAEHPTLLQRPIAMRAGRAVVGRPVERILDLLE